MACSKRSFLMKLCLSVAATFAHTWRTLEGAAAMVHSVYVRAADWAIERLTAALPSPGGLQVPRASTSLVQARAFVQRLLKREKPRLTPGWRMCPSI